MLETILISVAAKVGAPLVKSILEKKIGGKTGELAADVIDKVAESLDVEPAAIPDLAASHPEHVEDAVKTVEADAPEMIELWTRGLDGQFALLQAEIREGPWQSGWRWGWMYFLGLLWAYALVLQPLIRLRVPIDPIDIGTLLTLTGWFLALYMGGHTLKALGESGVEAVRAMREGR